MAMTGERAARPAGQAHAAAEARGQAHQVGLQLVVRGEGPQHRLGAVVAGVEEARGRLGGHQRRRHGLRPGARRRGLHGVDDHPRLQRLARPVLVLVAHQQAHALAAEAQAGVHAAAVVGHDHGVDAQVLQVLLGLLGLEAVRVGLDEDQLGHDAPPISVWPV
jgi:hypothetical protein